MNSRLVMKAQALDNAAPDDYWLDGRSLAADDHHGRQCVTNMIASVAAEGKYRLSLQGAELITSRRHFLVQILSEQRDNLGRRAPIVSCGVLSAGNGLARADLEVLAKLRDFSTEIGRTLDAEQVQALASAFAELARKRVLRRAAVVVGTLVAISALLIVVRGEGQNDAVEQTGNRTFAKELR